MSTASEPPRIELLKDEDSASAQSYRPQYARPDWREGLVEAFPIPEDRKPVIERIQKNDIEQVANSLASLNLVSQKNPFPFFNLPSEIRNRVYGYVLFSKPEYRGTNGRRKDSRLACLMVNKRMHQEASYVLYSTHKFKVFPLQVFDYQPSIQELPPKYRASVANLSMVVGSSWTSPPKTWKVSKLIAKCLSRMPNVRTLKVFVELDPTHPSLEKYRISYDFYTNFCGNLLRDTLKAMPQSMYVELDGNTSVDVRGPLVSRLREEAEKQNKIVKWGSEAGWLNRL